VSTPNGRTDPAHVAAQDQAKAALEAMAYANYPALGQQLGAVLTLLRALPVEAMLTACKRLQATSVLTLPVQVTAEQAAQHAAALRNDETILRATLTLVRTIGGLG
jgi:hypothetical protein